MNDSGSRLISGEEESCPGCLSLYTCEIGNSQTFVKRRARIIPGCSHNLCENCIEAEGDSTGQVSCRHPGCSTKVAWTGAIEEFFVNVAAPERNKGMYTTTNKLTLTEPKELGTYSEASACGVGGAKHKEGSRSNIEEEVTLARECAGCGKDIKKSKIQLMCACGLTIYCSGDCQKSSGHRCYEVVSTDELGDKLIQGILNRYYRDRAAGRGPSSDSIKELAEKIRRNEGRLRSLAEDGDPIAAYLIGSAYFERRVKLDKQYEDLSNGKAIWPLGYFGKDHMWFGMPPEHLKKSRLETNEISIKWLKVAAEGGVPEAMYLLCFALKMECGLEVDKREALYWLDQAYRTGKMEYLIESLVHTRLGLAGEFDSRSRSIDQSIDKDGTQLIMGESFVQMMLAARWKELKQWGGKTAKGEDFYSWVHFKKILEKVGEVELQFIYLRPGFDDLVRQMVSKERKETNIKFKQGMKMEVNPDVKLIQQGAISSKGRTAYLVTCKHDQIQESEKAGQIKKGVELNWGVKVSHTHNTYDKKAGDCQPCAQDAWQRLRSVAGGQYSISLTEVIPDFAAPWYAARYVNENGVIMQDIFKSYSKPDLRQVLQCLMSNPADLHPLAVAEDLTLYWGIIWYWGSVYHAVEDTCNKTTINKIFGKKFNEKGGNSARAERGNENDSGLAAFPESAAGEWRIACGNEACNKVDHEVKFMVCAGCKVRRYCGEVCQERDWNKHKKLCKAAK